MQCMYYKFMDLSRKRKSNEWDDGTVANEWDYSLFKMEIQSIKIELVKVKCLSIERGARKSLKWSRNKRASVKIMMEIF